MRTEARHACALAALGALFAALVAWSAGRWTDPVIDFGFELYVPWRLTEGDVLYRDIAYRNGPFSPYANAAVFAALGVSVRSLVVANLAVLAAIVALLYALLARATSALGAFAGAAGVLCVCAFSQYGNVGNYDFATPYQHGQTHGLALGLGVVALCVRALRAPAPRTGALAGAGALLGALALTKAETFVPGAVAAALAVALAPRGTRARAAAAITVPAFAVFAGAVAALATALPLGEALRGALGNAPYLGGVGADAFYAHTAGLDAPARNAARMLGAIAAGAALAAACAAVDRAPVRIARAGAGLAGAAALAAAAAGALPWADLARALPAAVAAVALVALSKSRSAARHAKPHAGASEGGAKEDGASEGGAAVARLLLGAYALALLAKLGLHPQVQHYGFALAAPALALAAAVAATAPRSREARALALALVAAFAVAALRDANEVLATKTFALGEGRDRILVAGPAHSPRGAMMARAMEELARVMPEDATLLAMPEGAGLNYWLRRRNPTPYSLFLPPELRAHGGAAAMLARIEASPPDFVALVHRGHAEFGTGPFLRDPDYGAAFLPWLERDYRVVATIGAEPFRGPRFGIVVLERARADDGAAR